MVKLIEKVPNVHERFPFLFLTLRKLIKILYHLHTGNNTKLAHKFLEFNVPVK